MPAHDWSRVEDGIFHDLHLSWIFKLKDALNEGLLPECFYSLAEQHAGHAIPDILTLHRHEPIGGNGAEGPRPPRGDGDGGLLLAEAPPRVSIVTDLENDAYTQLRRTLTIRHVTDDTLVALIEIVSAGNKSSDYAFDQFLQKILAALQLGIHVLIADLHPRSTRDPRGIHAAVSEELGTEVAGLRDDKPLTLVSYCAGPARRGYAEPLAVGEKLADMPLFLSTERYVNVPLEETYAGAFRSLPRHLREVLDRAA